MRRVHGARYGKRRGGHGGLVGDVADGVGLEDDQVPPVGVAHGGGHAHLERVELRLRPARRERERLVHDLVAEDAAAPPEMPGDDARGGGVALLDAVGIGEELAERGQCGRSEAPGLEIGERTSEVRVVSRAEQQI